MNEKLILQYLDNYFCKELGDGDDLEMALEALNESGSLGFYYYITKKFEEHIAKTPMTQQQFQAVMNKWFHHSVENLSFISL